MALKANRNYQDMVKAHEERKAKEAEAKQAKARKEEDAHKALIEAQRKEFMLYIEKVMDGYPKGTVRMSQGAYEFIHNMGTRLMQGQTLTENMVNALRKFTANDKPKAQANPQEARTITLKIRQWFMKTHGLDSRIITGKVIAETAKAYLIHGHADMLVNMCWCVRCGKELTEPASQITGMGETCAEKAGIPYDPEGVLRASKAERQKIREQFIRKLHNQKFEAWVPKSQVEEVLETPNHSKVSSPKGKKR